MSAATAKKDTSTSYRNRQLAQVHVLKKQLGMSDDLYRATMLSVTGCNSAADLNAQQLRHWAAHLQNLKAKHNNTPARTYKFTSQERLIWSLWQQLADKGLIKNRKMEGLMGYVNNHISKASHISWLNGPQQERLIEQLKKWLERGAE